MNYLYWIMAGWVTGDLWRHVHWSVGLLFLIVAIGVAKRG